MTAIARFLPEPDDTRPNPHYTKAAPMRFWLIRRIKRVEKTKRFLAWADKVKATIQDPAIKAAADAKRAAAAANERIEQLRAKYGSWQKALPLACEGLFSLNRYAKHRSCPRSRRDTIYELKNRFVELVYRQGYCIECYEHQQSLPEQRCFGCDGTGTYDGGQACHECGGDGVYQAAKVLTLVCFRFDVLGRTYCWHQPNDLVTFEYRVTADSSRWQPEDNDEKTVLMDASQLAGAEELLRWIIDESAAIARN